MNDFVRAESVTLAYGSRVVLEDVTFELRSPFIALLMGPNGAGKTTLIRAIVGVLRPVKGRLSIYGMDPYKDRTRVRGLVGYVPQILNVSRNVPITVEEVVAMGLLSKLPPPRLIMKEVGEAVRKALSLVGLEGLENRLFSELSGGQQQRVLIARALLRRPKLLVLDEPYSMLDFQSKCDIVNTLKRIHEELGTDIIMSAHDVSPCASIDPIIILINRRVFAIGKIRDVLKPEILRKAYPGVTEVEGMIILGEDHAPH